MLRVFLSGPPRAERADPWVRYAADGRVMARGRDVPARWPSDGSAEAILASAAVRLAAVALPPLPRNRVQAAVRFALEDQLASAADEAAIAVGDPRNGAVVAAVTSAATISEIERGERRFDRILPEPALAPHADGWTWCLSAGGDSFVRRADGSAFAAGAPAAGAGVPFELGAALAQASRARAAPATVHVAFACDAAQLARWSEATGVRFAGAAEWHWEGAMPSAFAGAPDFADRQSDAVVPASTHARAFRPALALAAAAIVLYVGGLVAQWAWLTIEDWRVSRALSDAAASAQLPPSAAPAATAAAIARHYAELRHRAGLAAPADALPLLARAAAPIGALPAGALRSAHYSDDAWMLELAAVDAAALARLTRSLRDAGIDAVSAPTAAGMRVRLALQSTAR